MQIDYRWMDPDLLQSVKQIIEYHIFDRACNVQGEYFDLVVLVELSLFVL